MTSAIPGRTRQKTEMTGSLGAWRELTLLWKDGNGFHKGLDIFGKMEMVPIKVLTYLDR
jgi:hypothetical protein